MSDDVIAQATRQDEELWPVMGGDAATMGLGAMTDARWKDFFKTMSSEGLYTRYLDYTQAFDNRFVNKKLALEKTKQ